MDTLPPELHTLIFSAAISLDRKSFESISLTCRRFYAISRSLRFQSIHLECPSTASLVYLSSALRQQHHPVSDVYIADVRPDETGEMSRTTDLSRPTNWEALVQLLPLISRTVERLTFIASFGPSSTSLIGYLYSLEFPRLHSLSLLGFYPFPRGQGVFPNLRRMWLSGNRNPHGLFTPGTLDLAAPQLEALVVEGVYATPLWANEVAVAANRSKDPCKEDLLLGKARFPKSLKRLTVRPGKLPPFQLGRAKDKDREMRQVLSEIACVDVVEPDENQDTLSLVKRMRDARQCSL